VIVLDTNVLSEALRPSPDAGVLNWLGGQSGSSVFTTRMTRGELFYGVRLLPDGQRRRQLLEALQAIFDDDFAGQVLSFDQDAADAFARIAASRKKAGRPISQLDAMIAGITRSRGAGLATRNTKDFDDCGIDIINPWDD